MAVLKIRQFGDPVLRQRAQEVAAITDVHRRLIEDMIETMRAAPGVGLAGPQVGVMERIFVWEVGEEHGALINPRFVDRSSETVEEEEGCLSMPGLAYPVRRHHAVTIEALDEDGNEVRIEADDLLARVFQHESDHLDGVLFIDHISDEDRREALRILRDRALGLPVESRRIPTDERL